MAQARGSPSRGCPTLPGLRMQRRSSRRSRAPSSAGSASTRPSLVAEAQRAGGCGRPGSRGSRRQPGCGAPRARCRGTPRAGRAGCRGRGVKASSTRLSGRLRQPGQGGWSRCRGCPGHGCPGQLVEVADGDASEDGGIVVALHRHGASAREGVPRPHRDAGRSPRCRRGPRPGRRERRPRGRPRGRARWNGCRRARPRASTPERSRATRPASPGAAGSDRRPKPGDPALSAGDGGRPPVAGRWRAWPAPCGRRRAGGPARSGRRHDLDLRAPATRGADDRAGLAQLGAQAAALLLALPGDDQAALARQGQGELQDLGQRADGARRDDVPGGSLVGLLGEVLGTLGDGVDGCAGRRGRPAVGSVVSAVVPGGVPSASTACTAAAATDRKRAFLPTRLEKPDASERQRGGQRQTRVAAAAAHVQQPVSRPHGSKPGGARRSARRRRDGGPPRRGRGWPSGSWPDPRPAAAAREPRSCAGPWPRTPEPPPGPARRARS